MYILLNTYVCDFQQKDMIPVHYAAFKDHDEVVELFFKVQPSTMTQINAVSTVLDFKQSLTRVFIHTVITEFISSYIELDLTDF